MKRSYTSAQLNSLWAVRSGAAKRRRTARGNKYIAPRRAYAGSMVPLRSGGYRPNVTERKVNDITTATYQANTTGSFTLLALPVTGADFNQRIGRKILLKSVYIRGRVAIEAAIGLTVNSTSPQQGRMIIFADLQPNGAAPAVTDLLVEATPSSQLNLNNRDRFKVYSDQLFAFDAYLNSTTLNEARCAWNRTVYNIKKYKKINLETIFNATNGGTIADINSGALYMFWIGSVAAGTADINAILSTRVRYSDK